jgi:hypothetical protein
LRYAVLHMGAPRDPPASNPPTFTPTSFPPLLSTVLATPIVPRPSSIPLTPARPLTPPTPLQTNTKNKLKETEKPTPVEIPSTKPNSPIAETIPTRETPASLSVPDTRIPPIPPFIAPTRHIDTQPSPLPN